MSTRKVANDDERTQSTAGSVVNNTAKAPLSTFGDQISSRLDDEIVKMKPTNRSSDLVPLNHRYVFMQKELKGLIEASKTYHRKMVEVDQARMEASIMANDLFFVVLTSFCLIDGNEVRKAVGENPSRGTN